MRRAVIEECRADWWKELFDEDYLRAYSHLPARAEEEAEAIRCLLGLEPGERVLDIPCGQGRHAGPLCRSGVRVVGADWSPSLLPHARDAGCREIVRCDMRQSPFAGGVFDAAYNVFTSFGYFADPENLQVLREIARVLRPGGRFLLETINREAVLQVGGGPFPHRMWFEGDGRLVLDEVDFDPALSRLETRRILVRGDGSRRELRFSVRAYAEHELRIALADAGFEVLETGGGMLAHGEHDPVTSRRKTYLARKP